MKKKLNANDIKNLLIDKYSDTSKWIALPECKTGASYGRHGILDFWVSTKSWVNFLMIGYEIKVDRGDFLNDTKWTKYLDYCNELYFVCPCGLIDPKEIPDQVGLMITSTNGTRLYTKKKAPNRKIEIPIDLILYILMWRCSIHSERFKNKDNTALDYWKNWLHNKKIDWEFGHHVSKSIQKIIEEQIEKVQNENQILKKQMEQLYEIKNMVHAIGMDEHDLQFYGKTIFKKKLDQIKYGLNQDLIYYIKNIIENLSEVQNILEHKDE